jgi:predicted nucleic acid-binding protein
LTLVVDASVAFKWLVNEPGTADALALPGAGIPLLAPELILAELCNIAWKSWIRG